MELQRIYQAIGAVSQKVNDLSATLNQYIDALNKTTQANIDYVAMMTDVELPTAQEQEERYEEGGIENAQ